MTAFDLSTPPSTRITKAGTRVLRLVVGLLFGAAVAWWVAEHSVPTGEAVVHVSEANVDVEVGGRRFRVDEVEFEPIRIPLSPGRHPLVMTRNGETLYRGSIEIRRGAETVATVWDDRSPPPNHADRRRIEPVPTREYP